MSVKEISRPKIVFSRDEIASFCRQHHILKFAFFGSVLRDDFRPESDVDVLVEFTPGKTPGFIRLAGMELELEGLLGGHTVDLNTPLSLSKYFRDQVLQEAAVVYVET